MEELVLTIDGRARRAVVHVPSAAGPWPLVMLLHGSGGSGAWVVHETRWDEIADAEGILLVAPDATRPKPDQPPRFYTNPAVWNDGSRRPPVDRVSAVDDVGFLAALLDEAARRWPVDPARVYVTGFSNGAGMTFRVGLELAGRLAAIAPVAGHFTAGGAPVRSVRTLYLIGTRDPLIPVAGGVVDTPWGRHLAKPPVAETLRRWALCQGLPPEPTEIQDDGMLRLERWPDGRLEAWFIGGLGHHWPGGRAGLNPRIAGPAASAVNATAVIWDFFQR